MTAARSLRTQAAIDEAMSATRPEDVIEGVKTAVQRELAELDPRAKIEDTKYFNHSFVPDFVVTWIDSGNKRRRDIYLRPSLASTVAARDVEALGGHSPVLLSLRPPEEPTVEAAARRDVGEHAPDTLITGVSALDEFTGEAAAEEPLQALVRPNLVRGGRGVISGQTLATLHAPLTGGAEDVARLEAFGGLVREAFVPDAATRLERAAQILEIGLTGNVSSLNTGIDEDPTDRAIGGRLSDVEMEVLLPYLLGRTDVTTEPAFWAHIGRMINLARLEELTGSLSGLDLTPLVKANLRQWVASRASLAATGDPGEESTLGEWRIFGRTLATHLGQWRLHITADSRRLRGREDSLQARWDDLVPVLRGRPVTAVALNGIQRRVNVTADQAADVFGDVTTIRASINDEFYVPEVSVRASEEEDAPRVDVDFTRMIATSTAPTPLRDLAEIATVLLGHRVAVPEAELLSVFGEDVRPQMTLDVDERPSPGVEATATVGELEATAVDEGLEH